VSRSVAPSVIQAISPDETLRIRSPHAFQLTRAHPLTYEHTARLRLPPSHRERFPEGWLKAVSRCSFDQLNKIPSGWTDPSWPHALTEFVQRTSTLSLCRERVVVGPGVLSPLAPTSSALSAAMAAGVPGKKRHEARVVT
jgi:hypothetical protein